MSDAEHKTKQNNNMKIKYTVNAAGLWLSCSLKERDSMLKRMPLIGIDRMEAEIIENAIASTALVSVDCEHTGDHSDAPMLALTSPAKKGLAQPNFGWYEHGREIILARWGYTNTQRSFAEVLADYCACLFEGGSATGKVITQRQLLKGLV